MSMARPDATLIAELTFPDPVPMKLLLAPLLCLALLLGGCSKPSVFASTDISTVDWGKDFSLTDHNGQARHLADFRGKAVVLFFGYTQCPDVCPTTLATLRDAMALLGEDAKRVQVLFVTVDPARDTPALLAQYAPAFHPSFLGLYADEKGIAAVAKEFKVFYAIQPGSTPGSYSVDHSTGSYAFDTQGKLRLLLRHGETPGNVATDLKLLLAGK
jgi:protein SCO1/2